MLMVVDIGNTHITIGFYEKDHLRNTFRLTTDTNRTSDEIGLRLSEFLQLLDCHKEDIIDVVISSVVPKIMHSFNNAIRKYLNKEPLIISPNIYTGIQVQSDNPQVVGADRIVDLAGCFHHYGGNTIVVDFGTATTFDYLDEKGIFKYGVIVPGIGISANALWERCAKLPEIEIKKPKSILGSNTVSSMQAGLVYGYIGQCEYIIAKMKEELHLEQCQVIATGGLGRIIANHTKMIDIYDPHLTFKGLKYIYSKNKE